MKDMSPVTASADASTIFQAFEEFYRTYARLLGQLDLNADVRGATSHGENMVFCLTRYKTIIEVSRHPYIPFSHSFIFIFFPSRSLADKRTTRL